MRCRAKPRLGVATALIFFWVSRTDLAGAQVGEKVGAVRPSLDMIISPHLQTSLEHAGLILPSFLNGGVIVFFHVPKTGGTTIRRNLETLDGVEYIFGRDYSVYKREVAKVEDAILYGTNNGTILFFEFHANDSPSFYVMRKRLQRWRDTANENGVPIFFFSLLRDPLAFAFSHFSFFHLQERNPTFERCSATDENFLRLSLWNPQCQFLFKGEASMRSQNLKQIVVQFGECADVKEHMFRLLDWVGTTETLSDKTLPLLARLMNLPDDFVFRRFKVSRESGETFGRENVTASSIAAIREMSALDYQLHEKVQRIYRYSELDRCAS